MGGLKYNVQWYLGAIVAAWTVFGFVKYETDVSWRVPVALQSAMPLLQILFLYWIPESPRWLCAKGHQEKAFQILVKVSGSSRGGIFFSLFL